MIPIRTERQVERFKDWVAGILPNVTLYDFKDKHTNVQQIVSYMINKTQSMFTWTGLPESIPQKVLEKFLQINGNICFYEHEGTLYVFTGGLGGEPNVYYMPTIYTIANPALNISKNLKIGEECVVMHNDSMSMGLMPLMTKYATMQMEQELTLHRMSINMRSMSLISAQDDRTKVSAEKYLKDLEGGEAGVIAESAFLQGLRVQAMESGKANTITQIRETIDHTRATFYTEIGIRAALNMKREQLVTAEVALDDASLLPLVDDMLRQRQYYIAKVNEMFGTNISVELNSAWNLIHAEALESETTDDTGGDVSDNATTDIQTDTDVTNDDTDSTENDTDVTNDTSKDSADTDTDDAITANNDESSDETEAQALTKDVVVNVEINIEQGGDEGDSEEDIPKDEGSVSELDNG